MKIHTPNLNNDSGFTIVETLIAIAVLMIAIAGPLVIASKGLTAALYSKDQMIASFLAQESMEVIKNIRDVNYDSEDPYSSFSRFVGNCDSPTKYCDADPLNSNMIEESYGYPDGHRIYFDATKGYTSSQGGNAEETIFSRYFYMEDVEKADGSGPDPSQKRVHVVVSWKEGVIPFETEIVELITSAKR